MRPGMNPRFPPVMKCVSMFCAVLVSIQSLLVTPWKTPIRLRCVEGVVSGTMPARSRASHVDINDMRCAGSIWGASLGEMLKKRGSNSAVKSSQQPHRVAPLLRALPVSST